MSFIAFKFAAIAANSICTFYRKTSVGLLPRFRLARGLGRVNALNKVCMCFRYFKICYCKKYVGFIYFNILNIVWCTSCNYWLGCVKARSPGTGLKKHKSVFVKIYTNFTLKKLINQTNFTLLSWSEISIKA